MIRSAVARCLVPRGGGRRTMAGGFPSKLKVKKNKFVEEWNGRREITEEAFTMDIGKVPTIFMTLIVIPAGVYYWVRGEFQSRGDRRYKNMV